MRQIFYELKHTGWIRKITGYVLLIIFLGFYGSITLFSHTHHIENGIVIVHSHPYRHSGHGEPLHSHTSNEIALLQFLAAFTTTQAKQYAVSIISLPDAPAVFKNEISSVNYQSTRFTVLFRGPPVSLI